ncbi:hypothetical protein Taro_009170 [Colocasia esculenta]|uniref:PI3K/PI4K catalytic domain-containing protein n=1 Tax=Colocasia esculenta TaxID=4460 RepID=A0A843U5P0_COLES|nr:hypothetical protein [Colocasia esculenta]
MVLCLVAEAYGRELQEAHECCLKYKNTGKDAELTQLFGLVNTLLENSRKTAEKDLSIQRYAVIPLSPNSGLIGWVPNCDTLHQLIREYREARKAFVHDPLINWRLFNFNEVPQMQNFGNTHIHPVVNSDESAPSRELPQPLRGARERELLQAVNQLGDANEVLNERAVAVMARMSGVLFGDLHGLVDLLYIVCTVPM